MKKSRAIALIIISSFMFATSVIFFRNLTPYGFTPMQLTAVRGVVSAILLLLFILVFDRKLIKVRPKDLLLYVPAGIFMFFAAFCYYTALNYTSAAVAVVLMYAAPVYVLIFSVLFLKEKMTVLKAVAVTVMLAGLVLVSGVLGGVQFSLPGVLFALAAGVFYAGYNIVAKFEMNRECNPVTAMFYCYLVMGILASLFADVPQMVQLTVQGPTMKILLLLLGLGSITCGIPYLMYTVSLKGVPTGTASTLSLIEPMAAIVYGLFFQEMPELTQWIGVVLILGAVFMISRVKE